MSNGIDLCKPSPCHLNVKAYIDGHSILKIREDSATWCNLGSWSLPDKWNSANEQTRINGRLHSPVWKIDSGDGCSESFGPLAGPLPKGRAHFLSPNKIEGKGTVFVRGPPLEIEFEDPDPGAHWYEVDVGWE
jgi:hypothetical protein